MLRAIDPVKVGNAAGGDDDDIRIVLDRAGLDGIIQADLHPEPLQLPATPVDDADKLAAPTCLRGQQHLSTEPV